MEEQSRHGHADTAGSSTKSLGRPGAGVLALAAMELLAKAPVLGCAGKMQRQRQRGSALGRWICRAVAPPRVRLRDGRHLAYAESGASKEDARFKVVFSHGFTGSRLDTVRPAPVSVPPRPLDLALHGKDSSFCGSACVLPPSSCTHGYTVPFVRPHEHPYCGRVRLRSGRCNRLRISQPLRILN